jgi:Transposase DNA-binding
MYVMAVKNLQSAGKTRLVHLTPAPDWTATHGGYPWSLPEGQVMDRALSFGEQNFGGIELGDSRRTDRLVRAADGMCRHPGGTLPDKFPRPANLRAFYRLMNCDRVTHEVLMRAHANETRRRIAALTPGVVLVLHDATELDYTSKKSLELQLGQIGQGTHRGYICHNSLAVRLVRNETNHAIIPETLGLLSQILHHRPRVAKDETSKEARERVSRESRLWLRGVQACGPAPTSVKCVDVSDSLSDTFEYMAYEVTNQRHFVLRARENRRLEEPINGEAYLFEAARSLGSVGTRTIKVEASPGRKARATKVHVAFTPVCLALPGKKSGNYDKQPLPLWAVRVWEPNTPADEEPLEWTLLTNCPVTSLEEAFERIGWYELRWIIEEYHKGMKTGCGIETLQFEHIKRLEPAIALISAVATTLLRLRDAARAPDAAQRLATEVVDRVYVDALASCYPGRLKGNATVLQFYMHVARLGGHQNRKRDGFPGWLTLWRGWTKLESMVIGFTARSVTCGKT